MNNNSKNISDDSQNSLKENESLKTTKRTFGIPSRKRSIRPNRSICGMKSLKPLNVLPYKDHSKVEKTES